MMKRTARIPVFGRVILFACVFGIGTTLTCSLGAAEEHAPVVKTIPVEKAVRAVPDHDVSYEDTLSPEWKLTWDTARQLYRDQKYKEALVQYELLLAQKESVEEARWEYTSILLHLQRWEQAVVQLEKLLVHDKANAKYLFALADSSLACGHTEKALKLYNRLYREADTDAHLQRALSGLVKTQDLLGNRRELLPLIEELLTRNPEDLGLQKKQAALLVDLGSIDRAGVLLDTLEESSGDDSDLIRLQALLHGKKGDLKGAVIYWQKLLSLNPDDIEAHRELKEYFVESENWAGALENLEAMLKNTPDDADLLGEAADVCMKLGRTGGALEYYEYALALKPWDEFLQQKKREAQKILAQDLLVLVENNGTEKLWDDLVQVTADRPGIYREIASLLRQEDQVGELIEVLRLLYNENPDDRQTYAELASLLKQQGRTEELADLQFSREKADQVR